jgi:chromosome segregation ATPase
MNLEERIDGKVDEINDIYIKTTELKNSVHKLFKNHSTYLDNKVSESKNLETKIINAEKSINKVLRQNTVKKEEIQQIKESINTLNDTLDRIQIKGLVTGIFDFLSLFLVLNLSVVTGLYCYKFMINL